MDLVVIEDDSRYREGLEQLFTHTPGIRLAGAFSSAVEALQHLEDLERSGKDVTSVGWDLAIMDLDLPGMTGIAATAALKKRLPEILVVVLTVFEEPSTILEAICSGADGYLLKRSSPQELLAQIRVVSGGGAPLTAGVARSVLDLLRASDATGRGIPAWRPPSALSLTSRESEVLRELVRGLAYKQVAQELDISIDTVRYHIRSVYRKLQVHSVAEAVSRAIRERLV
jgi:DNA-binding NarL/FixJ family response regulator